ncbi:MAG: hypothetical protein N3B13_09090, partial [Deltaproteobacteria bacterium]|nr:hypothetical protein [Deltaproteobacteria bacterium]
SEPICIDKDTDLGELLLPDACNLTIRLDNTANVSSSEFRAEVFIADKSVKDFVKITEQGTKDTTINLKVPGYLCR